MVADRCNVRLVASMVVSAHADQGTYVCNGGYVSLACVAPVDMCQRECDVGSESRQGVGWVHGYVQILGSTSRTCAKFQTHP